MRCSQIAATFACAFALCLGVAGCQSESGTQQALEVSPTPSPGEVVFSHNGTTYRDVAIADDGDLLFANISPDFPCGPFSNRLRYANTHYSNTDYFLEWAPDGDLLFFHDWKAIRKINVQGTQLVSIADLNADIADSRRTALGDRLHARFGHYASLSPDGRQLVYSTCSYDTESFDPAKAGFEEYWQGREKFLYELAIIATDGGTPERITENKFLEHYPVWSPDGARIAFLKTTEIYHPVYDVPRGMKLLTMDPGDFSILEGVSVPEASLGPLLYPPTWSPNSQHLAFVAEEGELNSNRASVLYTVRLGGSVVTRVGEAAGPPAWSPAGDEIAFATFAGNPSSPFEGHNWADYGDVAVHVSKADGTGLRTVWRSTPDANEHPVFQIAWSPDGTQLLFATRSGIRLIHPDGSGLKSVFSSERWMPGAVAWSPDGVCIAVYNSMVVESSRPYAQVLVMLPDGSNVHVLAETGGDGEFRAMNESEAGEPIEANPCSTGRVNTP